MNNFAKVLVATAAVVAVVDGHQPASGRWEWNRRSPTLARPVPVGVPSSMPTPEPTASLVTRVLTPFGPSGFDDQDPRTASITVTFDAPASWAKFEGNWSGSMETGRPMGPT